MKKPSRWLFAVALPLAAVAVMFWVEQSLRPGYWIKSAVKAALFLGIIALYAARSGRPFGRVIRLRPLRGGRSLLLFCLLICLGVVGGFLLLRPLLDTDAILASLTGKEHLTRQNCLFIFTYVAVVNSFLEEAFFRGYLTDRAGELLPPPWAALYSAVLFAVYHIGIVSAWFSPLLLALSVAGLAAVGLFLQLLCRRFGSLKASWLVHASANVAINAIGAILIFSK